MEAQVGTRRRRWWRRALFALLVLAVLLGGAVGGLALWLRSDGGREVLRAQVLEAARGAIAGRLEAGGVEVSPTGHVRVRDLKLFTPEGELVAELASLDAEVDLLALRGQVLRLSEVTVLGPRLLLVEDARGWNLSRALAAKASPAPAAAASSPTAWRVEARHVFLSRGFFDLQQEARRVTIKELSASAEARVRLEPLAIDGELVLSGLVAAPLADEAMLIKLSASSDRGPQVATFDAKLGATAARGEVELPALALRLQELVADPRELKAFLPGWPLRVPVFGQGVASPKGLKLSLRAGRATAEADAALDLERSAVPSFSVAATGVDLAELVGAKLASRLEGKLSGRLDDFHPETLAGQLTGEATWDTEGQRLAAVSLAATAVGGTLDFSRLELATPGAALSTRGTASLTQLALTGSLEARDLGRVSQTLKTYAAVDTEGLRGRGTLALTVTGPTAHPAAKAVGTLSGFAVAGLSADSISVDADVPDVTRPLNTDTTLRAKRLRVGERTFEEVTLDFYTFGRRLDLDLSTRGLGDLKVHVVGTLDTGAEGAELQSAELTAADTRWVMEGTTRLAWGERFELSPLTLREGERRISARARVEKKSVDAEVRLLDLELARLPRAVAPPELELGGQLTGEVSVKGRLASPAIEGWVRLRNGQAAGITGIELDAKATWSASRAVGTVDLQSAVGKLGGTFDVPVAALLEGKPAPVSGSLKASDVDLKALEARLGRTLPASGLVGATLELSGSAEAPTARLVVEAPTLEVDLDAEAGAPLAKAPRPLERLRGRARRGSLETEAPVAAPEGEPAPHHRVVRVDRPKLTVFTTDAHTLSAEVSASALGGVAIVTLETPLTIAGLRKQVPTVEDALALPVVLGLDVQGLDLDALHEAELHDAEGLEGALSLVGTLRGAATGPRGALTLGVKRGALPPFREVDGAVTLRLEPEAVTLDGGLSVRGKPMLTLAASLGRAVDALIAAARAKGGDPLAVAGDAPFSSSLVLREVALASVLPPPTTGQAPGGEANATFEVHGTLEAPQARLFGALQGLRFDKVGLGSARFDVRLQPRAQQLTVALGGQGRDDLKVKGALGLDLRLSSLRRGLDWRAATVDAGLQASNFDLAFLSGAHERLRAVAGKLDLNGDVSGTLGDPVFVGDVVLTKGRLALAGNGDYRDLALELHVTNDRLELSRLSMKSGAGEASVKALVERQPSGSYRVTASAKTERFPLVNDDQLLATTSLTMALSGEATSKLLNITKLSLPHVEVALPEIKRKDLQDLQRPSDIIVLRSGERAAARRKAAALASATPQPKEDPFVVRAIVDAPRNLWLKSSDVNVELGLSEGFRVEYADALQLFGEASLLRGSLSVIGREFSILKGSQVRFAGVATKPYVNVSALHVNEREQVKITVAVTGKGSDVSIKPSSEPPMPESDIYTVLATGRRQLQRGTGAAVSTGQALSVIGQFVTSKAKTVLAKALPIDVLNFETSDDLQRFKVDVGKYLSDTVYFGVSANIGADRTRGENVFAGRLEYQVTRSVSLEAYAGDALSFGVDAVWSRDF